VKECVHVITDAPIVVRAAVAIVVVGIVAALLTVTDADLTVAAIVLLLAVAALAVLGYAAGLAAALSSTALLNYYFTPPLHSFRIGQADDIVALIAFVSVSLFVAAAIARLNELRRRARVSEREARLRASLAEEVRRGTARASVLQELSEGLTNLFELSACAVLEPADAADAAGGPDDVVISTPPLLVKLRSARPLRDDEIETITGVAGAVATLLELERVDAVAREQRVQGELDRSRAGFLTGVTHDLRTPLATIKAATAALLAEDSRLDPTERRELLEDTFAEAARLEGLVNKVLELTRIRAGALRPELVTVSAVDLVRLAVDRSGRTLDGRTINLDFDPELPDVCVDALFMEHVLVNLFENIAVHDPSGGGIDVRGGARGPWFELRVIDHGPGIPVADRERIFDEFFRLGVPTDGKGTGLGLAIVRALVLANRGAVRCEETPAGGATFVVNLPIASEEEAR
jgi:two-component system sensor histidine kinase KdpD